MTKRPASSTPAYNTRSLSAKKAKPNEAINDLNRRYQDAEADVVIISSDGLRFRVHSYQLMAASVVLRSMLAVGDKNISNEIELTDTTFEKSGPVSLFLDIIHGRSLEEPADIERLKSHENLLALIRKYEATSAMETFRLSLWRRTSNMRLSPWVFFRFSYMIEDDQLAYRVISAGITWKWNKPTDEHVERSIVGARTFDLTSMDWYWFKDIPDHYKFALLRAFRKQTVIKPDPKWSEVAEDFKKIIEEMRRDKLC